MEGTPNKEARNLHLKRKLLIFPFLLALLIFQLIQFSNAPTLVAQCSDFTLEINMGGKVAFQSDDILEIEVTSGLLNGSSCSLSLYDSRGTLAFWARNTSIIEISSPDAEGGFDISISGATSTNQTDRFTWDVNINTGNNVSISWSWRIESWIGNYTMFTLGIGGLGLMVFSPTWGAYMIRKKGLDPDTIERCAYALLLFCVGFGLFIMWLWT